MDPNSFEPAAILAPPENLEASTSKIGDVEDAAAATKRKFMEEVWARSRAAKTDTKDQGEPGGNTKALATPPLSDAPPKELQRIEFRKSKAVDMEEMEFLTRVRDLPLDSEERSAMIEKRHLMLRERKREARKKSRGNASTALPMNAKTHKKARFEKQIRSAHHNPQANTITTITTITTNQSIPASSSPTHPSWTYSPRTEARSPVRKITRATVAAMSPKKSPSGDENLRCKVLVSDMGEMVISKEGLSSKGCQQMLRKKSITIGGVRYTLEPVRSEEHNHEVPRGNAAVATERRNAFSVPKPEPATPETKASSTAPRTLFPSTPPSKTDPFKATTPQPSEKRLGYGLSPNTLNRRSMEIAASKATRVPNPKDKEIEGAKHLQEEKQEDKKPTTKYSIPGFEDDSSEDEEDGGAPLWA
ncbi:hypothetical protein PVAG01_02931 [Phlyctema vagabunda]|uniref:Uncharacterized protein n=1 Tax=Phlyctema vagabunda TaxID=108571 RepID=A0ABR4PSA0_9HELO